ncbi:hypothetical protein Pelo_671 [Pelomyxa schiedti]|nr:hypothetical protein Pelo_671 [Pelomyxa schiedti]
MTSFQSLFGNCSLNGGPAVTRRIRMDVYGAKVDLEDYKVSCHLLTTEQDLRLQVSKYRCTCRKLKKKIHKLYELSTNLSQVRLFVEKREISDAECVSCFTNYYSTVLVDPDGTHTREISDAECVSCFTNYYSTVLVDPDGTHTPPLYSVFSSPVRMLGHKSLPKKKPRLHNDDAWSMNFCRLKAMKLMKEALSKGHQKPGMSLTHHSRLPPSSNRS